MPLTKIVNGEQVPLTLEEEQEVLAKWALEDEKTRLTSYRIAREHEYPSVGDQLDAILKQFNLMRLNGQDMNADLDSVLASWLAVKAKYPKPTEEVKQ